MGVDFGSCGIEHVHMSEWTVRQTQHQEAQGLIFMAVHVRRNHANCVFYLTLAHTAVIGT